MNDNEIMEMNETLNEMEAETPKLKEDFLNECSVEVKNYVKTLEGLVEKLTLELQMHKTRADQAFEAKRATQQQYDSYKTKAEQKLLLVQGIINNAALTMKLTN